MHYSHKILSHSIPTEDSFLARIKVAYCVADLLTHPPLFEHREDGNIFTDFHKTIKALAKSTRPSDEIQAKREEIYLEGMRLIRRNQLKNVSMLMAGKKEVTLQNLLSSPWQFSPFIDPKDRHSLFQHVIKTELSTIETSDDPKTCFKNCLILIQHLCIFENPAIKEIADALATFCASDPFKADQPLPQNLLQSGIDILHDFTRIPLAERQNFHGSTRSLPDFPTSSLETPRSGRERSQSLLSRVLHPFRKTPTKTPTPDPLTSATFNSTTSLKDTVLALLESKDGCTQLASHLTQLTCTLCNEFDYDILMAKLDGISLKAYPNAFAAFETFAEGLTQLVITIIQESTPEEKSKLIKKIIKVAITCKDHHDIVTARILLSGLIIGRNLPSKHNQLKEALFNPDRNQAALKALAVGHSPYPIDISYRAGMSQIENEKRSPTCKTAVSPTTFLGLLKIADQFFDPDRPLRLLTDAALLKEVFSEIIQYASSSGDTPPSSGCSLAFLDRSVVSTV